MGELEKLIARQEKYCPLIQNVIDTLTERLNEDLHAYERAKLELEIFEYETKFQSVEHYISEYKIDTKKQGQRNKMMLEHMKKDLPKIKKALKAKIDTLSGDKKKQLQGLLNRCKKIGMTEAELVNLYEQIKKHL